MASFVKRTFQTDNDKLEFARCLSSNVVRNLGYVSVVKGGVDFVEDKERSRLITKQCKYDQSMQP